MAFKAIILALLLVPGWVSAQVPSVAWQYRAEMTRSAWRVHGPNAPVALLAAQIHQESGWDCGVTSWAGAQGCGQFMPGTAQDAGRRWPTECYPVNPFKPKWAFNCRDRYMQSLLAATKNDDECSTWAFGLRSYNGGLRNLRKDIEACRNEPPSPRFCGAGQTTKPSSPGGGNLFGDVADPTLESDKNPLGHLRSADSLRHSLDVFRVTAPFFGGQAQPFTLFISPFMPRLLAGTLGYSGSDFLGVFAPKKMIIFSEPSVLPIMLTMGHGLEVLGSEVGSVVVDVVNENLSGQSDPEQPLGYQPVNVGWTTLAVPVQADGRVTVQQKNSFISDASLSHNIAQFVINENDHNNTYQEEPTNNVACQCDVNNWQHVGMVNAGRRESAYLENKEYPERIFKLEPRYFQWGRQLRCIE